MLQQAQAQVQGVPPPSAQYGMPPGQPSPQAAAQQADYQQLMAYLVREGCIMYDLCADIFAAITGREKMIYVFSKECTCDTY
jgi:hypothetical protein